MVRTFNYQRATKKQNTPPQSLVDFLTSNFKYHDNEQWIDTIRNKKWVSVDGTIITDPKFVLPPRCTIDFDVPEELEPEVDDAMTLLYLDEHIGVVCKSGNLPVSEGGKYSKRTLVNLAARKFLETKTKKINNDEKDIVAKNASSRFIPVHRLDKETSGIVVMARTHEATVNLGKQFSRCAEESSAVEGTEGEAKRRDRKNDDDDDGENENQKQQQTQTSSVSKEYIAVMIGNLTETKDIQFRIGNESEWVKLHPPEQEQTPRTLTKFRMICAPKEMTQFGKEARTIVTPIRHGRKILIKDGGNDDDDDDQNSVSSSSSSSYPLLTLCRVQLFTGRTHQIRIHCAAIGFPLLGDKLYVTGGGSVDCETYLRRAKGEEKVEQKLSGNCFVSCSRHLLHATKLAFSHPLTKEVMSFESDPKQSFLEACPDLAKFNLL